MLDFYYYHCNTVVEITNLNTDLFPNTWFKESSNMKFEEHLNETIKSNIHGIKTFIESKCTNNINA